MEEQVSYYRQKAFDSRMARIKKTDVRKGTAIIKNVKTKRNVFQSSITPFICKCGQLIRLSTALGDCNVDEDDNDRIVGIFVEVAMMMVFSLLLIISYYQKKE
jgi:hypothetical protein